MRRGCCNTGCTHPYCSFPHPHLIIAWWCPHRACAYPLQTVSLCSLSSLSWVLGFGLIHPLFWHEHFQTRVNLLHLWPKIAPSQSVNNQAMMGIRKIWKAIPLHSPGIPSGRFRANSLLRFGDLGSTFLRNHYKTQDRPPGTSKNVVPFRRDSGFATATASSTTKKYCRYAKLVQPRKPWTPITCTTSRNTPSDTLSELVLVGGEVLVAKKRAVTGYRRPEHQRSHDGNNNNKAWGERVASWGWLPKNNNQPSRGVSRRVCVWVYYLSSSRKVTHIPTHI